MVRLKTFSGKIPKSGKSIFTFGGRLLHHRATIKETFLVDVVTKVILGGYPVDTTREVILESIARNHDIYQELIRGSLSYETYPHDEVVEGKKKTSSDGDTVGITMDSYSDGSCVVPRHLTHEKVHVKKKCYNLTQNKGW